MFAEWVTADDLGLRLDTDWYTPEFVSAARRLSEAPHPRKRIGDAIEKDARVTYGIVQPGEFVESGGVPMIRAVDLLDPFVNSPAVKRVSTEIEHPYRRARVQEGDVLISIMGTLGAVGICPSDWPFANLNQAIARVRLGDDVDPYFFAVFVMSEIGQLILGREAAGTVQRRFNIEDIPEIQFLCPDRTIQEAIGNKVRKAERLRALGEHSWLRATAELERKLNVDLSTGGMSRFTRDDLNSADYLCRSITPPVALAQVNDELGAQYFHPRRVHARQTASRTGNYDFLASVASRVSRGSGSQAQFVGLDAIESKTGIIDSSLIASNGEETGCSRFREDDVLFSRLRPYLNKVSIWPRGYGEGRGSGELLVYRPKSIDPHYLFFVLKSELGLQQIIDVTAGSTHPRVDAEVVDQIVIPRIDESDEIQIGKAVAQAHAYWYQSQELIPEAKRDVDALIAGTSDDVSLANLGEEIASWLNANPLPASAGASNV